MNTDEILLQILEEQKKTRSDIADMRSDISEMRSDITQLQTDVAEMRSDITELQDIQAEMLNRQNDLEKDVKSIKLTIENDVSPSIKLLSELQLQNSKRLIVIKKDVQGIKDDIAISEVLDGLEKLRVSQ